MERSETSMGSMGSISYRDALYPEKLTLPVETFFQLKEQMDRLTRDPRYSEVSWQPNPEVIKPFTQE